MILTEIYPARELPIPGVTSQLILDEIKPGIPKRLIKKEELPALVEKEDFDVLMVLGAGDADIKFDIALEEARKREEAKAK